MKVFLLISSLLLSFQSIAKDDSDLFRCNLSNSKEISIKINNESVLFYNEGEKKSFNKANIRYNKYFRYKTEYIKLSLPDGVSIFRNYDGENEDFYKYGIAYKNGNTIYCLSIINDDFDHVSDYFKCDLNDALGCEKN